MLVKAISAKEGGNIGHIIVFEFTEDDSLVFDEIMGVINRHSGIEHIQNKEETMLSFQELEIYPDRRKVYYNKKEVYLTPKEYDILFLLMANKGRVITYENMYEKVWGEEAIGNEKNSVRCHVSNLREKLHNVSSKLPFVIRCVREVGYCFEVKSV